VDPGINGRRLRRDDGTEVQKFSAPKAVIMALITDGILRQKLPWTLVLLGVFIALVLELAGVPALPFAVGVYLPLSSSAPIFAGGVVRYLADRWARTADGRARSASESDMSPGVLLSTGYIAGGAIGGILINMLLVNADVSRFLHVWQYRHVAVTQEGPVEEIYRRIAAEELGLPSDAADGDEHPRFKLLVAEIRELNADRLPQYALVPAGTVLKLPRDQSYQVSAATPLGDLSEQSLGSRDQAAGLFDLNSDRLKLPTALPAGAMLRLPQRDATAVWAFAGLAVLLLAVGGEWFFRPGGPGK
jgi:hypothetical protein